MARPKIQNDLLNSNRLVIYLTDRDINLLLSLAANNGIAAGVLGRILIKKGLGFNPISNISTSSESLSFTNIN